MRVLIADPTGTPRHPHPVPCQALPGEIVLSDVVNEHTAFRGIFSDLPAGTSAIVGETDKTVEEITVEVLAACVDLTDADRAELETSYIDAFADAVQWIQDAELGAAVTISESGEMEILIQETDEELRGETAWIHEQIEEGLIPFIAIAPTGSKLCAIPDPGHYFFNSAAFLFYAQTFKGCELVTAVERLDTGTPPREDEEGRGGG